MNNSMVKSSQASINVGAATDTKDPSTMNGFPKKTPKKMKTPPPGEMPADVRNLLPVVRAQYYPVIEVKDPETGKITKERVVDWASLSTEQFRSETVPEPQDLSKFVDRLIAFTTPPPPRYRN